MGVLANPAAERAIIAGVCKYGEDGYLDVADMVQSSTFTVDSNRVIWKCIEHIFQQGTNQHIDVPTILSAAQDIGLKNHFDRAEEAKHLAGVLAMPVKLDNVRHFAAKCRKLEVGRLIRSQMSQAQDDILEITGDESILSIISMAEIDFSSLIVGEDGSARKLGEGIRAHLEYLAENPVEQIGISTGFPAFDESIGGGLRDATINVIAARPKTGKTLLSDNMGYNIARQDIPVLNLDTEMTEEDHYYRVAAMIAGIPINDVESGKFGRNPADREAIWSACDALEKVPYFYRSIAGKPFEDQLALIRRWLVKDVGLNPDGTAKPCVIIYDYLKLMDSQGISADMKEYQLLGFMMTSLHNFAHRYKVPILAFMQLNRDGIEREDTSSASGSDRIIWLCSNFTIFKIKSDEEIQEDGVENGNRKLKPVVCRHGAGMEFGNYINCHMTGYNARIREGRTKFEIAAEQQDLNEGFIEEADGEDIPFE